MDKLKFIFSRLHLNFLIGNKKYITFVQIIINISFMKINDNINKNIEG